MATLFAFAVGACTDLLDQEPQGEWTPEDNTAGTYQAEIYSLYSKMRGFNVTSGNAALAIHNFRCEDIEKGSTFADGSDFAEMYDNFEYIATHSSLKGYYIANYEMIHAVNRILDELDTDVKNGVTLKDNDIINQAEAHFFRAFAYFNLVRAFGEVPYIDFRIHSSSEGIIEKSPASKIYELIDSDLTEAENVLPTVRVTKYMKGGISWGAARSLHARTYLMRNDWENTYAAATEVINSGLYDLNTPFNKIFRESGENCSESILEAQCTATASMPGDEEIGCKYSYVQGVRGAGQWDLGWGWHTPTKLLAAAFEPGDPRKDETLLYFLKTGDDPNSIQPNTPYGEKPVANRDVVNAYYNKKAYTDPDMREKYNRWGFWFNIRLIRYADVVLMAAESANELGKTIEASGYLEQIRARARGGNNSVLPKVTATDQSTLRNAIRQERRIELAMEWDRFYDLVRWGTAKQVLRAAGKTYEDKHALLPLPQSEIDSSNGVLKQNPDYTK